MDEKKAITNIKFGGILNKVGILKSSTEETKEKLVDGKTITSVPISQVYPDPNQPRKNIDTGSEEMKNLADSINKNGFIHFPMVIKTDKGYMIVSGERRYHAAKMLGLTEIPVSIVSNDKLNDVDLAVVQIEENLQRSDISPIEEARAYQRLVEVHGLRQIDIISLIKRDRNYVSRMMSINKINNEILDDIVKNKIDVSRRVLHELAVMENQKEVWEKIRHNPVEGEIKNFLSHVREKKSLTDKPKKDDKQKFDHQQEEQIFLHREEVKKAKELELDREIKYVIKLELNKENFVNIAKENIKLKAELEQARLEISELKKQNKQ